MGDRKKKKKKNNKKRKVQIKTNFQFMRSNIFFLIELLFERTDITYQRDNGLIIP